MATSPNYGWSEPDNTSLVKDGAQAMRTLGNSIDTSVWNVGMGQAGKNKVINGAMQIWQRGTSITGTTTSFSADRWQSYRGVAGSTFSRQVTNDTTNLPNIQYCLRVQRDSGNTSTTAIAICQNFETINSIPFAGKTVTLSFYARAGANFSQASSTLPVILYSGTGTDQNTLTGYSGQTAVITGNSVLTTTWQRFTYTGTVATSATELSIYVGNFVPVGTAGANDYYEITGVQLEAGSIATPFQTASGGSIQGELAMCQRYYYDSRGIGTTTLQPFQGAALTTSYIVANCPFKVSMRATPTLTLGDTSAINNVRVIATNAHIAVTPSSYPGVSPEGIAGITFTGTPVIVGTYYDFYLLASAEL